jgi:hypothetical protein
VLPAPLAVAALIVPQAAAAHAAPPCVSVHVTPLFAPSWPTVAVKTVDPERTTLALGGATETVIAGTLIVADAVLVVSAAEVAVIVTVRSLAGAGGV